MTRQQGLTLIELVIAIAITALTGVLAASMLRAMTGNNAQIQAHNAALTKLQRDLTLIQSDLDQVALRTLPTATNQVPDSLASADTSSQPDLILAFTRYRSLPALTNASVRLERVRYLLQDQQLIRQSLPVALPANDDNWYSQTLLQQVNNVQVGYLFQNWHTQLPQSSSTPLRALRLKFQTDNWDELEIVSLTRQGGS